jgi:hypothetical protein
MAHPILDRLSQPKARWWIAGGVVLAAVAVGGFALAALDEPDLTRAHGPELNIAVVPPVEPDVEPGDVMDVGQLNNSFDGRLPEPVRPVGGPVDLYADQPAYIEADQGWRIERPPVYVQPGPKEDPYQRRRPAEDYGRGAENYGRGQENAEHQGRPMAFGFDRPQPDWRAEREARRAAMEAREQAREDESRARVYSSYDEPRRYRGREAY